MNFTFSFYLYFITAIDVFIELFPVIFLFMRNREKRQNFSLRLSLFSLAYFALGYLAMALIQSDLTLALRLRVSFAYAFLYLMLMGGLCLLYRVNFRQGLFDFIVCYSIKMFCSSIYAIGQTLIIKYACGGNALAWYYLTLISYVYLVICYYLFFRFIYKAHSSSEAYDPNAVIVIFCLVTFLCTLFLDSGNTDKADITNNTYVLSYTLITLACYLLIIFIQFGFLEQNSMRSELALNQRLWKEREKQLLQSKESSDLISLKYHDIKHLLTLLQEKGVPVESKNIQKLDEAVNLYDSVTHTGNEMLDALLSQKSLAFHENGIRFSCVAQGEKLSFMNSTDLMSLFGNALENATEAVMKLPKDQRFICLSVEERSSFLLIRVDNPYQGELSYANGGLKTSKQNDSSSHGWGVKSMKLIVKQYHGDFAIVADKGIFSLQITLPLPENAVKS